MRGGKLISVLPAVSSVLIHEAGHIIAASAFGVGLERGYRFFGIRIMLDGTQRIGYVKEAIIYAAGAAFNLLSLLIPGMSEGFYVCSVGAALFNLIPFPGSDGSAIIAALMASVASPIVADKVKNALEQTFLTLIWLFAVYANIDGRGNFALLIAVTVMLVSKML